MEAWQSASAANPSALQFKARVGYWQSQLNQLDLAQTTLSELLQKRFDAASASELGFVKFRKGDVSGAARLLKDVIRKEPDLMAAHYYLGAVHYQLRDAKAAKAEYLWADRLAPQDPRPLTALCQMQSQLNSPELGETQKLIESRFADGKAIAASCERPP
jgi:tetratricopeptide (TPR) repeat protein